MLRSEKSSNNEEDDSPTLLGKILHLSLVPDLEFSLAPEEVLAALSPQFSWLEEQGLVYFAGYAVRKIYRDYHKDGEKCGSCEVLGERMEKGPCPTLLTSDLFLWLKRYDENCRMYKPTPVFTDFVKKVSLLVGYCFASHLEKSRFMSSIKSQVLQYITCPTFCTPVMKGKVVHLLVKTLCMYKLKWLNDSLRNSKKKSARKLKILKHQ